MVRMSNEKIIFIVYQSFTLIALMLMGYIGFLVKNKDPNMGVICIGLSLFIPVHLSKVVYTLYYWVEYKEPSPMTREQKKAFFVKIQKQRQ